MKYTCIDSFSGAGGLTLGLKNTGFNILLSFDIDNTCIETHKLNSKYFQHKSLVLDIKDTLNNKLLNYCNLKRGELFLLAGGPPCQGFSIQRIGSDHDIRNDLVLYYSKLVNEIFPMFFVMENVSGITGKRGKPILDQLISEMESIGYETSINLIDAQDYGVPQRRKRIIIVGQRKDLNGKKYEFSPPSKKKCSVRQAIEFLPEPPEDFSEDKQYSHHKRDKLSKLNLQRISCLSEGQGRDFLPNELKAKCHKIDSSIIGHRNVYGRMKWDDVAPTITARFDSFTRGQFGHPVQNRSITLREGAILQTFPLDFIFSGTKVEVARQIGNAVPPKLGEVIGASIIKHYKTIVGEANAN